MKKLNKNFYEQQKTVEAMTGICANNTCVCNLDPCDCTAMGKPAYTVQMDWYHSARNAFRDYVKA